MIAGDAARLSLRSSRRVLAAAGLSLMAHALVLASWHLHALSPPALGEIKPVEVTLMAETAPRVATRPPPRALPAPTPRAILRPAPPPTISAEPSSPAVSAPSPPARIEETLIEARADVASLNNPKPPYPLAARRQGLEGTALLSVHVREDGWCTEVRLKQSSGHASLDNAALTTVQRWRFVPARRGNTPVDSWVDQPIRFRLEK